MQTDFLAISTVLVALIKHPPCQNEPRRLITNVARLPRQRGCIAESAELIFVQTRGFNCETLKGVRAYAPVIIPYILNPYTRTRQPKPPNARARKHFRTGGH